ncbi:VMAP-C domain-containing protein [Streptomyces sp. 7N604]|uniref:VMAP-C domain-containing protein n=1 Tax=Streptomyces sp. 7N604 TaxID=3457415 RepID=UPI003FD2A86D
MENFHTAPFLARPSSVSILPRGGRRAAGSGVLLPGGRLLTCAHVVNSALGNRPEDADDPAPAAVRVLVLHPSGFHETTARPVVWIPPGPSCTAGAVEWSGDLAVLELAEDLPATVLPPRWQPMAEGQTVRAWHGGGHAATVADGRVTACDGRTGYVDGMPTGVAIDHGYSGGPLWSVGDAAVVGLVAATLTPPHDPVTGVLQPYSPQHVARRSWGIPWQRIQEELARAGGEYIIEGLGPSVPAPPDAIRRDLADILGRALPDPAHRADCARTVAQRCGAAYPQGRNLPSVDEFARLLATEKRAIPALTEILQATAPRAVTELLAVGRLSDTATLLSPREHRQLTEVLHTLPEDAAARLLSAVRAALPLTGLPSGLCGAEPAESSPHCYGTERSARIAAVVEHLEALQRDSQPVPDGTSGVPGLLRAVEFVAAVCPPQQQKELRKWSAATAGRLGVHDSALKERRADAEEWAARQDGHRQAAARVLVHLAAHSDRDGADRYRVQIWCDEGAGPRRVSGDPDRTRTAPEAAEEILGVLEPLHRAAPDSPRPLIEVLVDRDALELPVDQWEWPGPAGLLPGVLGAEYPLIVNCPELVERGGERYKASWRHRWRRLDDGATVHIDRSTGGKDQVYGLLMERLDAARVSIDDVPPQARIEIVQLCLAMGIPVVLWDRTTDPSSDAVPSLAGIPPRRLPEAVRTYRARRLRQPQRFVGRPVLAWADADRRMPQLELADPTDL